MGNKVPKMTAKEEARANKRTVDKSVRTIEREQNKMVTQEKKALEEVKKLAQKGQHVS
jgi:hypothetical protein